MYSHSGLSINQQQQPTFHGDHDNSILHNFTIIKREKLFNRNTDMIKELFSTIFGKYLSVPTNKFKSFYLFL